MNSLEEINKCKVKEEIPVWDFVNGQRNLKVSQNSEDKLSVLEFSAQVGDQIYFDEYIIKKSNIGFVKNSLALSDFEKIQYFPTQKGEKDYDTKLNILMGKK